MVGASRAQGEQPAENKCSKSKDEKKLSMGWAGVFRTTWEYGWRQEAAAAWGKVPEGLLRVCRPRDCPVISGGNTLSAVTRWARESETE